jgi:hypothetical protein
VEVNPVWRYVLMLAIVAVLTVVGAGCLPFPDRDPMWVTPSSPVRADR